jgi:uncharacterized protein (DUF1330 family)
MTAYVLFDIREITDQETFELYKSQVLPTTQQYDGAYRVVSGAPRTLEGEWDPKFVVLIEFPSRERAEEWYDSDAYTSIRKLRQSSADSIGVMLSGVDETNESTS